ncbi:MAG: damage-inducible protein DinB, partial [Limnohabitans sp.]
MEGAAMPAESAGLAAHGNRWTNQRLCAAEAALPEAEPMRDRGAFLGSLFLKLDHLATGDTLWLHRFAGVGDDPRVSAAMASCP